MVPNQLADQNLFSCFKTWIYPGLAEKGLILIRRDISGYDEYVDL